MSSKFYYFGFGSNMLAKRIRLQNPSAVRIGPGKLEDYRLDFHTFSKNWQGSPATIVPTRGSCVYGAIWEIDCCNMKNLDKQEGVSEGIYVPITVSVLSINCAETIDCRAYHLVNQPTENLTCMIRAEIPCDRQPSKTYLKTLVKGALETGVAADYIYWLRSIKHNGRLVEKFEKCLELQNVRLEI